MNTDILNHLDRMDIDYRPVWANPDVVLAICPFHPEKTPSFSISLETGRFYCYSCHASGEGVAELKRRIAEEDTAPDV